MSIIIHANPPGWKTNSLERIGYPVENCLQWQRNIVKVKRSLSRSCEKLYELLLSPAMGYESKFLAVSIVKSKQIFLWHLIFLFLEKKAHFRVNVNALTSLDTLSR